MISDVSFQLDEAGLVSALKSIMTGPRLETAVLKIRSEDLEGEVAVKQNSLITGARIVGAETGIQALRRLLPITKGTVHIEDNISIDFRNNLKIDLKKLLSDDHEDEKTIDVESKKGVEVEIKKDVEIKKEQNTKVESASPKTFSSSSKTEFGAPTVRVTTKDPHPSGAQKNPFSKRPIPDSVKDALRSKRLEHTPESEADQSPPEEMGLRARAQLSLERAAAERAAADKAVADKAAAERAAADKAAADKAVAERAAAERAAAERAAAERAAAEEAAADKAAAERAAAEEAAAERAAEKAAILKAAAERLAERAAAERAAAERAAAERAAAEKAAAEKAAAEQPAAERAAVERAAADKFEAERAAEERAAAGTAAESESKADSKYEYGSKYAYTSTSEPSERAAAEGAADQVAASAAAFSAATPAAAFSEKIAALKAVAKAAAEKTAEKAAGGKTAAEKVAALTAAAKAAAEKAEKTAAESVAATKSAEKAADILAEQDHSDTTGAPLESKGVPHVANPSDGDPPASNLQRLLRSAAAKANKAKDNTAQRAITTESNTPKNSLQELVSPSSESCVAQEEPPQLVSPGSESSVAQEEAPQLVTPSSESSVEQEAPQLVSPDLDPTVLQEPDWVPSFEPTVVQEPGWVPSFELPAPGEPELGLFVLEEPELRPSEDPNVAQYPPPLLLPSAYSAVAQEPLLVSPSSESSVGETGIDLHPPESDLPSPVVADPQYLKGIRAMIDSALKTTANLRATDPGAEIKKVYQEANKKDKANQTATVRALPTIDEPEATRKEKARNAVIIQFIKHHRIQITTASLVLVLFVVGTMFWRDQAQRSFAAKIQNCLDHDQISDAKELIARSLASFPHEPKFHYFKGRLLAKQGKMAPALAEYLIATAANAEPYNLVYVAYRARAYLALGQNAKAIEDLDRILEFPSKDWKSYADRAVAEMQTGKAAKAVDDAKMAIELEPSAANHRTLALAYALSNNYKDSISQWNWILAKNPQDAAAYAGRASAEYSAKKAKLAFDDLGKSIALKPSFAPFYYSRGLLYQVDKQPKAAIADYTSALRFEPKNKDYIQARAQAYSSSGDLKKAMADYHALAALQNTESKGLLLERSTAELSVHKYRQAAEDLGKLVEQSPNDLTLRLNHAQTCEKAEEFARALEDYSFLIAKDPKNATYYVRRGWMSSKQRHYDPADADFEKALTLDKKYAETYLYRGLSYADRGQNDLASIDFSHVLKLQPDNALAKQKSREIAKLKGSGTVAVATIGPAPAPSIVSSGDSVVDGYNLQTAGNLSSAIHKFAEAVKKVPNNAQARKYLAYALFQDGQMESACVQFKAMGVLGALGPADESKYADALQQSGNQDGAAEILGKLLKDTPGDLEIRMRLARIYWTLGKKQKTHELCLEGIKTSPNNAKSLMNLMQSLHEEEEKKKDQQPLNKDAKPPNIEG